MPIRASHNGCRQLYIYHTKGKTCPVSPGRDWQALVSTLPAAVLTGMICNVKETKYAHSVGVQQIKCAFQRISCLIALPNQDPFLSKKDEGKGERDAPGSLDEVPANKSFFLWLFLLESDLWSFGQILLPLIPHQFSVCRFINSLSPFCASDFRFLRCRLVSFPPSLLSLCCPFVSRCLCVLCIVLCFCFCFTIVKLPELLGVEWHINLMNDYHG